MSEIKTADELLRDADRNQLKDKLTEEQLLKTLQDITESLLRVIDLNRILIGNLEHDGLQPARRSRKQHMDDVVIQLAEAIQEKRRAPPEEDDIPF